MGVFLRWGVFGILVVAALVYAFNASKKLAENRQAKLPTVVAAPNEIEVPSQCAVELKIAQRALLARQQNHSLDRVLRTADILFEQDAARKKRFEEVAGQWYRFEGPEPTPPALTQAVVDSCLKISPGS
jgi:hypothetical protein